MYHICHIHSHTHIHLHTHIHTHTELSAPISLPDFGETWGGISGNGGTYGSSGIGSYGDSRVEVLDDSESDSGPRSVQSGPNGSSRLTRSRSGSTQNSRQVVAVRSTRGTTMVPSMRRGSLPPELRSLETHPSAVGMSICMSACLSICLSIVCLVNILIH